MIRKLCLSILIFVFSVSIIVAEIPRNSTSDEQKAGYTLLDKFVMTFKRMAETGSGGRTKVDEALKSMMADAKKAKEEKQIDPVFFRRYNRLLMTCKLFIVEDQEGILGPLIEREISRFVEDVKGFKIDFPEKKVIGKDINGVKIDAKRVKAIGYVADALAEEIINLHLYLDNVKKKEELRKEFEKKFTTTNK